MGVSRYVVICLMLLTLWLGAGPSAAAQERWAVPTWSFGRWILNPQRQTSSRPSDLYRCYVETLEHLGGNKVRMRDYRIRQDGQVVKNDATIEFGRVYDQPGGNVLQWRVYGNRSTYGSIVLPQAAGDVSRASNATSLKTGKSCATSDKALSLAWRGETSTTSPKSLGQPRAAIA